MDGEDRRHPCARPECAGHPPQRQEQEDRRGGVQHHVGHMMAAGVQAIPPTVKHVREPGQRMPVANIEGLGCPGGSRGSQPRFDMPVLVDVDFVVVIDKVMAGRLAEDGDHRQQQQAADGQQAIGPSRLVLATRCEQIGPPGSRRQRASGFAGLRQCVFFASSRHRLFCLQEDRLPMATTGFLISDILR